MDSYKYDPEADALYIKINPSLKHSHTQELADYLHVDYSQDGAIIGIEILNASRLIGAPFARIMQGIDAPVTA